MPADSGVPGIRRQLSRHYPARWRRLPVNLGLTAEGLAAQINKVGAKGLVVSSEVWSGKLDSVRGGLDSVETVFVIGAEAPQGTLAFSELSSSGDDAGRTRGGR